MGNYSIRKYIPNDKAQVSKLWSVVFEDSIEFIEFFLNSFSSCGNGYVCIHEDKIISMAFLLNDLSYNDIPCQYLYAVATDPSYRGMGIASNVINFAVEESKRNHHIVLTSPAESNLVSWYQRTIGATPLLTCSVCQMNKNDLGQNSNQLLLTRINGNEYLSKRETILSDKSHIIIGKKYMKLQEQLCTIYNGALIESGNNIAAVYPDGNELKCCELLCSESDLNSFLNALMNEFNLFSISYRAIGKDSEYVSAWTPISISGETWFGLILD